MSIQLDVTYGGAGTGKTTQLINDVRQLNNPSFVILSPTHSSLRNLTSKLPSSMVDEAKTVYSYFQIDYEHDHVVGPIKIVKHIYIDEFGLIKKELFKQILNKTSIAVHKFAESMRLDDLQISIHLYGDPVQLSPIYLEKRFISFHALHRYDGNCASVIEHDYNSLFSLKPIRLASKHLLTVNHRSNDEVLQLVKRLFYDMDITSMTFIDQFEVVRRIIDEGYVFISSRYDHQIPIYKLVKNGIIKRFYDDILELKVTFKVIDDLLFYPDAKFMVKETNSKHRNGEYVKVHHFTNTSVWLIDESESVFEYDSKLKLLPECMITAHKSQGLTISKVIVCTDDLFDDAMLYTMITRASESVLFYRSKEIDLIPYLKRFNDLLRFYGYTSLDAN